MKKLRKFLTVGVMVLSIIAMSGLTVNTAQAAAQPGDLIKMDGLSSVYYLGNDGKRYVFPSESVYFSWYNDFSGVITIPASELQSYPLGANVTMRPGTKLVKITTDPSVYAVTPNGVLRKIQSEADAIALYGPNWNKMVVDIADAFFTNYTIGTPLNSGEYPAGTLLKNPNNASIYYFDGTNYRIISSEAAFNANRFNMNNVVTTSMTLTASGTAITGAEDLAKPYGATSGSVVTGSGLTVALAASTPASGNLATSATSGQAAVSLAAFNFTAANDGAVVVKTIKLKKIGLSADSSLANVYLYNGNTKLTDGGSLSNGVVTFSNNNGLFTVAAGQTMTITAKADVAASATGNIGLAIDSASDVVSTGASVSGAFPASGNLHSFVTVTDVATVSLASNSAAGGNINAGSLGSTVFSTIATVSQRAVKLGYVALKQVGSINADDVQNLKLYVNGVQAGSVASIDANNMVIFDLSASPVTLPTGNTTLEVRADVVKGSSRSFSFQIQTASDIIVADSNYGINVAAGGFLGSPATFNINTGNVSITLDSNFTTDQLVKNAANVTLAKFTAKAYGEDMKFNNVIVKLSFSAGDAVDMEGINNLAVYVNGVQVGSSQNYVRTSGVFPSVGAHVGDANVGYASFGTNNLFTLTAGETATIEIKGDINLLASTAVKTIQADLLVDNNKVQGNTSYATWPTVASPLIGNSYTGKLMSIVSGQLGVSANTGFQNQTISDNTTMQKIGSYIINAGNAEAVRVTNLQVGLNTTGEINQISNVNVKYDSVTTPGQASSATMNYPVDFTIPANQSKIIDVYADLGTLGNGKTITSDLKVTATGVSTGTSVGNSIAQTGQTMTIGVGSMTATNVTLVSNQPTAQLIAGGTTGAVAATYKLTATGGTTKVTDLTFRVYNHDHSGPNTTAVQSIDLRLTGTSTILANAPIIGSNAEAVFSGLNISVPDSVNGIQVELLPHFNTVTAANQGGSATNNAVQFGLTYLKYLAGNVSTPITLGTPVYSNEHVLVAGVPTISLASDNPVGQTSGFAGGNTDMLKFTVTNGGSNTMYLKQVVLNSSYTTGATIATAGVKIYDASNTGTALNAAGTNIGATGTDFSVAFDNDFTIAAGQTATFIVRVNVTAMAASGDSVRVDLGSADAAYTVVGAPVSNDWAWNDGTITTYMNGFLFKGLPASGKPFVK